MSDNAHADDQVLELPDGKRVIELARKYENAVAREDSSDYLADKNGRLWRRFALDLAQTGNDVIDQDIFSVSEIAALRRREDTVADILRKNSAYFYQSSARDEERERLKDVLANRLVGFLFERGRIYDATTAFLRLRHRAGWRNGLALFVPKVAASTSVGAVGVLGSAELMQMFVIAARSAGETATAVTLFALMLAYFAFLDFRDLRPRPTIIGLLSRGLYPALWAVIYGVVLHFSAQPFGLEKLVLTAANDAGISEPSVWETMMPVTLGAPLLGTFLQIFWDQDTATRPL